MDDDIVRNLPHIFSLGSQETELGLEPAAIQVLEKDGEKTLGTSADHRWYEKKYLFAICGHTGPFRASLRATGYQKSLRAFFHRGKIGGQILRLARSRREHVQTHMSVKI